MARRTEYERRETPPVPLQKMGAAAVCGVPHTGCRARVIRTLAHRIPEKFSD